MGLLTDPDKSELLIKYLPKYYGKLSILSFLAGVVWLLVRVDEQYNQKTYFSENALLPGLVTAEYTTAEENFAKDQLRFLLDLQKAENATGSMPYDEIQTAFRRLGLAVYDHVYNFTTTEFPQKVSEFFGLVLLDELYSIQVLQVIQGRSVYAINRAVRAAGLESIVFSVPYRPSTVPKSQRTEGGIALMLSLAEFFRYKKYLAKDLIFVVTEHEHIGAKAFVEAYHGVKSSHITNMPLRNRAGSIQAAVNLEIPGPDINYVDLRIVGVNGQMPNLDLVNLVKLLFGREGVTFQNNRKYLHPNVHDFWARYFRDLETVSRMVASSASGQLEGNHAFFQQYNIQSVTIRGMKNPHVKTKMGLLKIGTALEGITRSLNNLLERFHQSFFFYLMTSVTRFVSIGLYMPPYGLLVLPIAFTALTLWVFAAGTPMEDSATKLLIPKEQGKFSEILPCFLVAHLVGVASFVGQILLPANGMSSVAGIVGGVFAVSIMVPLLMGGNLRALDTQLLKSIGLIEMVVGLYALSMLNFPLALLITLFSTPAFCWNPPASGSLLRILHSAALLAAHPVVFQILILFLEDIGRKGSFSMKDLDNFGSKSADNLNRGVVEYLEYGNWLVPAFHLFLVPLWIVQWVACRSNV